MNDNYNYYNGRRVTFNGFTQAITTDGKPVFYTDKAGYRQPLMMGVSEFGVPGTNEFIRVRTICIWNRRWRWRIRIHVAL